MTKLKLKILIILSLFFQLSIATAQTTFNNPILPSGADPWVIFKDGYYYYTHTTGRNLAIWKSKSVVNIASTDRKVVWTPPQGSMYSKQIWAPELHYIQKKWYMYFAADDGDNNNHRSYVIENTSQDPTKGEWTFKGQVTDPSNKWAIDGNVFEHKGVLYMMWSGWEGDHNGQQNIYIAKMKNPWTISGERVKLSESEHDWEKHGYLGKNSDPSYVKVNEGPQFLSKDKKMFIIYSASGCWTDHYALGMLSADLNSDPMKPSSWTKSNQPVFKGSIENKVFAPGHNSFFKSPDGKEDWILYHANAEAGQGCGGKRSPRAQPFTWDENGNPIFGVPLSTSERIKVPSGSQ
ncbi:MAG: glycosyl hydrolase family 43 [Pedobacter sp.]|nr:MAG: glycosyl hydrolase family 43 [Pedobacter sp.]